MSVKMSLQQWDLPVTINISLNGCEWKKLRRKTLAQDVFDRRWSLDGVKTLIKKSVRDLQLCWSLQWGEHCVVNHNPTTSGVSIVWSTTTQTRVGWALCGQPQPDRASVMTLLSLPMLKCFNPLKLYPLSGNIFRKWFASHFLFTHEHLIIIWSPTVTHVAVTTLLLTAGFHCC